MKRLIMFLMLSVISISVSAQSFAALDHSKLKHEQVMKPYQNEISDYVTAPDASVDDPKSDDEQVMKPYQNVILTSTYVTDASVNKWTKMDYLKSKSKLIDLPKFHSKQAQLSYYAVATTFVGLTTLFIINLLKVSKG